MPKVASLSARLPLTLPRCLPASRGIAMGAAMELTAGLCPARGSARQALAGVKLRLAFVAAMFLLATAG